MKDHPIFSVLAVTGGSLALSLSSVNVLVQIFAGLAALSYTLWKWRRSVQRRAREDKAQMRLPLSLLMLCAWAVLPGCATGGKVDRALFKPTDYATNITPARVQMVTTNRAVIVETTDAAGAVHYITNRETVTLAVAMPAQTNIAAVAWEVNPSAENFVQGITSLIPGYGSLAGALLTGGLAIVAHLRSRRFRAAAASIAEGVNHVVESLPVEVGKQAVDRLKTVQNINGTRETVRAILREIG